MLDPHSLADWGLNDEDRKAIAWAFARIETLERELDEARALTHEERRRGINQTARISRAIGVLTETQN